MRGGERRGVGLAERRNCAALSRRNLTIFSRLTLRPPVQWQGREGVYLHRGTGARAFERRFDLADFVKVTGASLENGLLSIALTREVPEEMKPRRIEIQGGKPCRKSIGHAA
jgi:hypothetical protein